MARHDVTFGRPELQAVRDAARAKDWQRLRTTLTTDVIDYEDRSDRIDVAATVLGDRWGARVPPEFGRWASEDSDDATTQLLRGAFEAIRAWNVRGFATAAETGPRRLEGFRVGLAQAETWLREAARLDTADPSPWVWLCHIARGQGVGLAETVERRYELGQRAPEHFIGHYEAIKSVGPSWGYHYTDTYECADAWTAGASSDSLLPALFFVANMERRRRHQGPVKVQRDPVARELANRATDSVKMAPCERPGDYWAHNYAAAWYATVHDWRRAKAHFALLGRRWTIYPWIDHYATPAYGFHTRRLRSGLS